MKIIIIGSNGFIGKNIYEFYKGKHDLLLLIKGNPIYESIFRFQPDIIINCAAEIYNNSKMFNSNIKLLYKLLEYCRNHPNCKLIHFGSSSEYGRKKLPMKETDFLEPTNLYEATKGMGTLLCGAYSKMYNFYCTVIRPFTVVGRYEKSHKLFPTLYKAYKTDSPINLSEGVHDFIFIDDFLKIFDKIIFYTETQHFNIINIGSGIQTTNEKIVKTFEDLLKYKYTINLVPKLREFDSEYWVCDITLLETKYKIKPKISIRAGINHFITDCERLNLYGS